MSTLITGAAGSGKTTELARRASSLDEGVLLLAPSRSSLAVLRGHLAPAARPAFAGTLDEFALAVLRDPLAHGGFAHEFEEIDDVQAALLFERAAAPLLSLEWAEFVQAQVDPEVPGLRAPARFLESAYRLICKLRDARIEPEAFLQSALEGAAAFYARPPNFAHPDLLYYTKDAYRDSLDVTPDELRRQYRREVDLAKILAELYRSYRDLQVRTGALTARDAVAEATRALSREPARAAALRARFGAAFVDDAQDLTAGDLALLQAVYGERLEAVTLAGDRSSATLTFRGARPDRAFAGGGERIVLEGNHRNPFAIELACRHLLGLPPPSTAGAPVEPCLTLFRAATQRAEAQFVADQIIALLERGVPHERIAVIFRSVANVRLYTEALVDRNVRIEVVGDLNLFAQPEALDALALLWNVHDPFRHDYLLRTLSSPALGLSDASLYALCSDPPDAQACLFAPDEPSNGASRSGRWDAMRDVRLGWNVTRGEQDARLSPVARERLQRFRALREEWVAAAGRMRLSSLALRVWREGLARDGARGSAREHRQRRTLERLLERIRRFERRHPDAGLAEFLSYAQERAQSDLESWEAGEAGGAVLVTSVEAARGRDFDYVLLPNVRAGAFPRWYVPDAFLYSPSLGMIAKENVGDASASRTAKFSYYLFRTKTREAYNREERLAFVYALGRARRGAFVTASERATRGTSAPEFLSELQAARLPGSIDCSERWRPARSVYGGASR